MSRWNYNTVECRNRDNGTGCGHFWIEGYMMVKCPRCGRRTESGNVTVNMKGHPDIRDWQDDGSLVVFFEEEM